MLYFGKDRWSIPTHVAGDGVRMALDLSLRVLGGPPGVVAVEEPENFMHPGGRRICAEILWAAVRRGEQVIASTHSLEFLDDVLESADAKLEDLALFKVSLNDGKLEASLQSGTEAEEVREVLGQDLRT